MSTGVVVPVGPFRVTVPEWWPVLRDGSADGWVVLTPTPGRTGPGPEEIAAGDIWPLVTLRFLEEPPGRNVVSAALRETFWPSHVRPCSLVLAYDAFRTAQGLPGRRHEVLLDDRGRAGHVVRWYVGAVRTVIEVTLTAGEGPGFTDLVRTCEEAVLGIDAPGAPRDEPPAVPAPLRDPFPETLRHAADEPASIPWESLHRGHEGMPRAPLPALPALPDDEQDRLWGEVAGARPALTGIGRRSGVLTGIHVYHTSTNEAVLVVHTRNSGGEDAREVFGVPAATAVLYALIATGVRADWLREIAATAPVAEDLSDPALPWTVHVGGTAAEALLATPRDFWQWTTAEERTVAEWIAPTGCCPLAVFRVPDPGAVVAGPATVGQLYGHLQQAWSESSPAEPPPPC